MHPIFDSSSNICQRSSVVGFDWILVSLFSCRNEDGQCILSPPNLSSVGRKLLSVEDESLFVDMKISIRHLHRVPRVSADMGNVQSKKDSAADRVVHIVENFDRGFNVKNQSDGSIIITPAVLTTNEEAPKPLPASVKPPEVSSEPIIKRKSDEVDAGQSPNTPAGVVQADPEHDFAICTSCSDQMTAPANSCHFSMPGTRKVFHISEWAVRRCAGMCETGDKKGRRCSRKVYSNHQIWWCHDHIPHEFEEYVRDMSEDSRPLQFPFEDYWENDAKKG